MFLTSKIALYNVLIGLTAVGLCVGTLAWAHGDAPLNRLPREQTKEQTFKEGDMWARHNGTGTRPAYGVAAGALILGTHAGRTAPVRSPRMESRRNRSYRGGGFHGGK